MIRQRKNLKPAANIAMALFFLLGCARVTVDSKQPIKVDVTMRLDVYQHVAKDVTDIEDMVAPAKVTKGQTSFLSFGVQEVYAQEEAGYPADVKSAIERRKDRRDSLVSWESKGAIGENAQGLVEVKDASSEVSGLVSDENNDRSMIYAYVASKNQASEAETAKLFAKRIQADAPQGTPIQAQDGSWTVK